MVPAEDVVGTGVVTSTEYNVQITPLPSAAGDATAAEHD